jgi:REP element-mobilizing transposase RayT
MDNSPSDAEERAAFVEDALDSGWGECLLKGDAARAIEDVLKHDDGLHYRLIAWCVMPTHVHVLVHLEHGVSLSSIVQTWKSVSAHKINQHLARKGQVWHREYYDRYMRDSDQANTAIQYIENNPVKAGLCAHPKDWRYSSAHDAGEGAGATKAHHA